MKTNNIAAIPARIYELLLTDDEFLREIQKLKKVNSSNFPKHDQWCDEGGLHFSFALAGYGPEDIKINVNHNILAISSVGIKTEEPVEEEKDPYSKEFVESRKQKINKGFIVRGIARRKFDVKYFVSDRFDLSRTTSSMFHGLLTVDIPMKDNENVLNTDIEIKH
jgi:HSP20 family molecular chaperone IbpA